MVHALTQSELADAVDIGRTTLNKYLKDPAFPRKTKRGWNVEAVRRHLAGRQETKVARADGVEREHVAKTAKNRIRAGIDEGLYAHRDDVAETLGSIAQNIRRTWQQARTELATRLPGLTVKKAVAETDKILTRLLRPIADELDITVLALRKLVSRKRPPEPLTDVDITFQHAADQCELLAKPKGVIEEARNERIRVIRAQILVKSKDYVPAEETHDALRGLAWILVKRWESINKLAAGLVSKDVAQARTEIKTTGADLFRAISEKEWTNQPRTRDKEQGAHAERVLRSLLRPSDEKTIPEWARDHYALDKTSPVGGTFDSDLVPWTKKPLLKFQDPATHTIFLKWGLQMLKSTVGGVCKGWALCEDPGPSLWYHSDEKLLQGFVEDRLMDSWQRTPPVAELMPRRWSWYKISFTSAVVLFNTIGSKARRTSTPARYVFGDEIKDWEPGHWKTVKKRKAAWQGLGKTMGFSTPEEEGDDVDQSYLEGTQDKWLFPCPHCGHEQEYDFFANVEFDSEIKDDEGAYNMAAISRTIRMVCCQCKGLLTAAGLEDDPASMADEYRARVTLMNASDWKETNPNGLPGIWTSEIPSLANPRVTLVELVSEFLAAKTSESIGRLQDLQDFYNQRLCKSWGDSAGVEELTNFQDYDPAELIGDDPENPRKFRIITADYQTLGVIYALCCQWNDQGECKYLGSEKLQHWDELEDMADRYDIIRGFKDGKTNGNVFPDIGWEKGEVLSACQRFGWRAMRGEDRDKYTWKVKKRIRGEEKFATVLKIVSKTIFEDPAIHCGRGKGKGPKVGVLNWSNLHIKDIVAKAIKTGTFIMPANVSPEFKRHLKSERKVKEAKSWIWKQIGHRPNHYWDCLAEQYAFGVRQGLVRLPEKEER